VKSVLSGFVRESAWSWITLPRSKRWGEGGEGEEISAHPAFNAAIRIWEGANPHSKERGTGDSLSRSSSDKAS